MKVDQTQFQTDYQWLAMQSLIEYKGQWIAVFGRKIIARNSSLKVVKERVEGLHLNQSPLYFRVPEGLITS